MEIDLTAAASSETSPRDEKDHMHSVINLLDHGRRSHPPNTKKTSKKSTPSPSSLKSQKMNPGNHDGDLTARRAFRRPPFAQSPPSTTSIITIDDDSDGGSPPSVPQNGLVRLGKSPHKQLRPLKSFHLFLSLPAELRNAVYRCLVVVQNKNTIELPRLTSKSAYRRAVEWKSCDTALKRRRHKTLFLEICQTSKQVYSEVTGIAYGENIFKFRCEPTERAPPGYVSNATGSPGNFQGRSIVPVSTMASRLLTLSPRALPLLRHVKVTIMSGRILYPHRVTDLLSCFSDPSVNLTSFEFTWFASQRCVLDSAPQDTTVAALSNNVSSSSAGINNINLAHTPNLSTHPVPPTPGLSTSNVSSVPTSATHVPVRSSPSTATINGSGHSCRNIGAALIAVRVTKEFKVRVLGEAVMTDCMHSELEAGVRAEEVEIQRKVVSRVESPGTAG